MPLGLPFLDSETFGCGFPRLLAEILSLVSCDLGIPLLDFAANIIDLRVDSGSGLPFILSDFSLMTFSDCFFPLWGLGLPFFAKDIFLRVSSVTIRFRYISASSRLIQPNSFSFDNFRLELYGMTIAEHANTSFWFPGWIFTNNW